MNYRIYAIGLTLSAGLLFGAAATPAFARDAAAMTPADCSKASSLMTETSSTMPQTPSSGDVDKDFAGMMMRNSEATIALAKIEMACGKNAKARKFAQRQLEQQREELDEARLLLGTGG